jgi:hypothetical protein
MLVSAQARMPGFNALPPEVRYEMLSKEVARARKTAADAVMMRSIGTSNDILKRSMAAKTMGIGGATREEISRQDGSSRSAQNFRAVQEPALISQRKMSRIAAAMEQPSENDGDRCQADPDYRAASLARPASATAGARRRSRRGSPHLDRVGPVIGFRSRRAEGRSVPDLSGKPSTKPNFGYSAGAWRPASAACGAALDRPLPWQPKSPFAHIRTPQGR